MAPERNNKRSTPASANVASTSTPQQTRVHKSYHKPASDGLPGVQKLKASLRQTRRLLAKDKLAADTRVETERRLRALEAELAQALQARKERALATRYHKIKFFERQKVTRKINQVKRQLAQEDLEGKEKKKLKKTLAELRIDLNYILHYPKAKKYISLFPPEVRHGSSDAKNETTVDSDDESEDVEGNGIPDAARTNAQRDEVRHSIKERMRRGELSNEPEVERPGDRATDATEQISERMPKEGTTDVASGANVPDIKEDAFFGDDVEE